MYVLVCVSVEDFYDECDDIDCEIFSVFIDEDFV